jgi:hypothetical protein
MKSPAWKRQADIQEIKITECKVLATNPIVFIIYFFLLKRLEILAFVVDSFSLFIILAFISSPVAAKFPVKLELLKRQVQNRNKYGKSTCIKIKKNVCFYVV